MRRALKKAAFGIALDIDGVLIRGSNPIPRASQALQRLSSSQVPFMLFTNGGGYTEKKKAEQLSSLLNSELSSSQIFLSHTPFREQAQSFERKRTLAIGKGEPASVLSEYGFRNVVSIDEYVDAFEDIDPLEQYKAWKKKACSVPKSREKIEAVFVVSDPVDWGRDLQVICDVLRGGGDPLSLSGGKAPPLFFAADDLVYQAAFPVVRFGMGAFRIALESIYSRLTGTPLVYSAYGKPNVAAYDHVKHALQRLTGLAELQKIYMIGDNPATDIRGAKQAGKPWFSVLVKSGCFKGSDNDPDHPADKVVEDVDEAVDFILSRENLVH